MIKKTVQRKINSTSLEKIENSKLSIQFSLDGFSFCISNEGNNEIVYFSEINFSETLPTPEKLLLKIKDLFKKDTFLQHDFTNVQVIHQNNLSTLVPNNYFDETKLKNYLDLNIKTLATDFIVFDSLEKLQAKNVYIPYVNINNYLFKNFGEFEFKHHITVLIEKLLKQPTFLDKRMYVNVNSNTFDVIVLEEKKLLLSNSFSFSTKEDFIYYILFIAEQLNLNTEEFKLVFTGAINIESEIYKVAYQYIRNVIFLESKNPVFKELNLSKHSNFILLG